MNPGSFWREPLLHFLIIGCGLSVLYGYLDADQGLSDDQTIRVDQDTLLRFVAQRTKSFDVQQTLARIDGFSVDQRKQIIDEYLIEEAYYRQAIALGFAEDDYVIRRRLVQKMAYLGQGYSDDETIVTEKMGRAYYLAHQQQYEIPGHITFTHVFFSHKRHTKEQARQLASSLLSVLNVEKVPFEKAPNFGERFPYHLNYVERPHDEIAGHFGEIMADELFALDTGGKLWEGVFESNHGSHLVQVREIEPPRIPVYEDVITRVRLDIQTERLHEESLKHERQVLSNYDVKIAPELLDLPEVVTGANP